MYLQSDSALNVRNGCPWVGLSRCHPRLWAPLQVTALWPGNLAQQWHMGGCCLHMQSCLKLTPSKQGSFNGQQTLTWQFQSWAALLINESKASTQDTSSSTDWCSFWFIMWNSLLENAYLMMCLQGFKPCPGNRVPLFWLEQSLTLKELHFKGMVHFPLLLPARRVFSSVR